MLLVGSIFFLGLVSASEPEIASDKEAGQTTLSMAANMPISQETIGYHGGYGHGYGGYGHYGGYGYRSYGYPYYGGYGYRGYGYGGYGHGCGYGRCGHY